MSASCAPYLDLIPAEALEAAGGERFRAAAVVLERLPAAVCADLRASARHNAEVRSAEAEALRAWALANGCLYSGEEFERTWRAQGEMGGSENDIIYDEVGGRVWKRNHVTVFCVSWRQFFERIILHGFLFPEAPVRFEGFLEQDGELYGYFSQPDIVATRGGERHECEHLMRARGFERHRHDDYVGETLQIEDLHPGNVLVNAQGDLIVIDPVIFPRKLGGSTP